MIPQIWGRPSIVISPRTYTGNWNGAGPGSVSTPTNIIPGPRWARSRAAFMGSCWGAEVQDEAQRFFRMKPMPTDVPLVSIVTPVYNAAAYLPECIESILAQTYPHWDYTIIDNCSTDDSPAIARSYAAKDSRIRVQRNDHCLPAMANHNMALRQLSRASKYCKVVFADDWIFPECLQKMVAVADEHPTAGIVGSYCLEGQQV